MLPVSVRCFQAHDLETPVENKLVTFVEISGDTADILSMQVMETIANYDLETSDMFLMFRGWSLRILAIVTYETATRNVAFD
jgi:hypothetical protein